MRAFIYNIEYLASTISNRRQRVDPVITTRSFRLHYPLNVIILTVLAILATYQIAGRPIQCSVDAEIDPRIMNTYCWIQSTYTLPGRINDPIGSSIIQPGVGSMRNKEESTKYHKYYQWVVFFLIFQAILFYVPHYIWQTFESGKIEMLMIPHERNWTGDLDLEAVTNFLSKNLSNNNTYFRVYILCEILNLVNVIGQIFFINMFLGYEFTSYGMQVLEFIDQDSNRSDPMDVIFPKISKCTFRKFGPSGNIIEYDGLCVLALNIFHEKIFIFLWFWFILLTLLTGLGVIWRLVTLYSHPVRKHLLQSKVLNFSRHPELLNNPNYDPIQRLPSINNPKQEAIRVIMDRLTPGDWFLLYQLHHNFLPHHYKQLIRELALKFGWKEPKID